MRTFGRSNGTQSVESLKTKGGSRSRSVAGYKSPFRMMVWRVSGRSCPGASSGDSDPQLESCRRSTLLKGRSPRWSTAHTSRISCGETPSSPGRGGGEATTLATK
uniref:Uncharacterized protein n=1 Tax=Agaricus bisporus TaxID=5341 RepID=A0A1Q1M947_AGABI|nr:hypothetical protein [Agaricus bisporus]